MSELFLRTLRDDPADAEVPSHKLLIRAGYVRAVGPGIYSWLPLGLRVLRKIENIVRQEMNAIGGQEILLPALLPRAPYETTNRWTEYGDTLFRLQDRRNNDYLLGPTHEELFTLTVKGEYSSYKDSAGAAVPDPDQVPRRGASARRHPARPRVRHEGLLFLRRRRRRPQDRLPRHREAYQRIFDRLGVEYVIVSAVSGAMGGSASEEFLAESEVGEDTFVRCLESGYAANVEAVITRAPDELPIEGLPAAEVHDTPDTPTIATLVDWANSADLARFEGRQVTAADTLKNVLLKTREPGGDWELLGDRCARRPRGRREAPRRGAGAGRVRAARRRRLRGEPVPGQGLHRPEGIAGQRCPLPGRPAGGVRHVLDHRCRRAQQARRGPGRGPRLHPGRHHRGRRGARRRSVARTAPAR